MHFDLKGFPSFSVLREQVDAEECREYDPILVNNNEKKYQMVNTGILKRGQGWQLQFKNRKDPFQKNSQNM